MGDNHPLDWQYGKTPAGRRYILGGMRTDEHD